MFLFLFDNRVLSICLVPAGVRRSEVFLFVGSELFSLDIFSGYGNRACHNSNKTWEEGRSYYQRKSVAEEKKKKPKFSKN